MHNRRAPDIGHGFAKISGAWQILVRAHCGSLDGTSHRVLRPVPHPSPYNLWGTAVPKFHALGPGEVRCRARNFHPALP